MPETKCKYNYFVAYCVQRPGLYPLFNNAVVKIQMELVDPQLIRVLEEVLKEEEQLTDADKVTIINYKLLCVELAEH